MIPKIPVTQVDSVLYRSPQPDFEDLLCLKSAGVKTVINLRLEAEESRFFATQADLLYVYLPVRDWNVPEEEQVQQFLEVLEDQNRTPALVHCAMGVGRTGTFVACYRVAKGIEVEEAIGLTDRESPMRLVSMSQAQKRFVREYAFFAP